jgi:hypothetical protein
MRCFPVRCAAQQSAEQTWPGSDDVIACLSVRSGLDLMLGQLGLPAGSEVLVSAVTIEDMVTILRHHGLVAVPIDVNPTDMSPSFEDIDRAITSRTKAMLIAHLFGTRLPLQPFAGKAREHGLLLWEDCAQAFDGRYAGHPEADAGDVQLRPDQDRDGARRWAVACARSRIARTDALGSRDMAVVQHPFVRVASRTLCGAEVDVGTHRLSGVYGDFETAGT